MLRAAKIMIGLGFVLAGIGTAIIHGTGDFPAGKAFFGTGILVAVLGIVGGSLFTASTDRAPVSPFGMKIAVAGLALAIIPVAISVLLSSVSATDVESVFKLGVAVMVAGLVIHFALLLRSRTGR